MEKSRHERTKKSKEPVEVDIRPMIHRLQVERTDNKIIMYTSGRRSPTCLRTFLYSFFIIGKTLHVKPLKSHDSDCICNLCKIHLDESSFNCKLGNY